MGWFLLALSIIGLWWNGLEDERSLREAHRLLRSADGERPAPAPESPSPHQLLGDVARPLVPSPRGHGSARHADRFHRRG